VVDNQRMAKWAGMTDATEYGRSLMVGDSVRLRELRDEDLPRLVGWWSDPANATLQANTVRPMPTGVMTDVFRKWSANEDPSGFGFSIVTLAGGELVGHIALWGIDIRNKGAALGIIIGSEYAGKGYGPDAVRVIVGYGFREIGLHRIELHAYAYNERAIAVYEKLGFTHEGTQRETVFHDGDWQDEVTMSLLAHEWSAANRE
jgi:RimJ/RimL family protein N-acetyltransferase